MVRNILNTPVTRRPTSEDAPRRDDAHEATDATDRPAFPATDVPMHLTPEQVAMVHRAVARNRPVYDSLADR